MYSYKKYVFLDPLAGAVTKTHTTLKTEKEDKPFDAPLSITKREQLERQVRFWGLNGWTEKKSRAERYTENGKYQQKVICSQKY